MEEAFKCIIDGSPKIKHERKTTSNWQKRGTDNAFTVSYFQIPCGLQPDLVSKQLWKRQVCEGVWIHVIYHYWKTSNVHPTDGSEADGL